MTRRHLGALVACLAALPTALLRGDGHVVGDPRVTLVERTFGAHHERRFRGGPSSGGQIALHPVVARPGQRGGWLVESPSLWPKHGQRLADAERTSQRPTQISARTALDPAQLHVRGVVASVTSYQGRRALRLVEPNAERKGGLALLPGVRFTDGTIEVDVAGRRGPFAVPDDRGFIGLAFRVRPDAATYEYLYIRPDNGRALDQVRRNHSTQYAAHPAFDFARLRQESPERYESYVDLEPGAWTRLRIDVEGTTARFYLHGAAQPALVVNDLKLGTEGGGIGLWIGPGTEGYFDRLRIRRVHGTPPHPFQVHH